MAFYYFFKKNGFAKNGGKIFVWSVQHSWKTLFFFLFFLFFPFHKKEKKGKKGKKRKKKETKGKKVAKRKFILGKLFLGQKIFLWRRTHIDLIFSIPKGLGGDFDAARRVLMGQNRAPAGKKWGKCPKTKHEGSVDILNLWTFFPKIKCYFSKKTTFFGFPIYWFQFGGPFPHLFLWHMPAFNPL